MFKADGQAQQAIGDPGRAPRLGRHGGMGHQGRVGDQAFDAAQGLGQGEDLELIDKRPHGRNVVQFETEHGPEAGLLPRRHGMARMRGQTRIVDGADRRLGGQPFGDPLRRRLLPLDAGLRAGRWEKPGFSGREITGSTMGLMGTPIRSHTSWDRNRSRIRTAAS